MQVGMLLEVLRYDALFLQVGKNSQWGSRLNFHCHSIIGRQRKTQQGSRTWANASFFPNETLRTQLQKHWCKSDAFLESQGSNHYVIRILVDKLIHDTTMIRHHNQWPAVTCFKTMQCCLFTNGSVIFARSHGGNKENYGNDSFYISSSFPTFNKIMVVEHWHGQ